MRLIREKYLKIIRPYYDVDLIKVITGVRRAGKSVILECIRDELSASGVAPDHIVFINLEDLDYEGIRTASDLNREIKARIADDGRYYLFIDEIQHVEGFEKALASFRATLNASIFVTGSNSHLLSGELATLLTGRTVEFEILPFSFSEMKEYYELRNLQFQDEQVYDYLKWGGFPLRFDFSEEAEIQRYLTNLYTGILNRDILTKKSRIDRRVFMDIAMYVLSNAGKEFSAESIMDYYEKKNHRSVSQRTVYNYLEKMQKAFLIHPVQKYDTVGKTALQAKQKYYAIDTGFRTIHTNTINFEDTFFLENIVYNELLFQGFTVFTGKTHKGEVDFVAIRNGKKCFIQVSYLMPSQGTIEREFGAFDPITDASPKYVLSLDKVDLSRNGIAHMNIVDFLLHRQQLALT
jgi:predicted AAA+ superfamily ATPase